MNSKNKYRITQSNINNYTWFRTAKCASTSILVRLLKSGQITHDTTQPFLSDRNRKGVHFANTSKQFIDSVKSIDDYDIGQDDKFKFAFVRNPYDRLYSYWYSKIGRHDTYDASALFDQHLQPIKSNSDVMTFENFIKNVVSECDVKWVNVHYASLVSLIPHKKLDFIGKFENLQEDFNIVCDKINIPQQQLPHKNRKHHTSYVEHYDGEMIEIIEEKYAEDIKTFNYKFGE